jgi:hypothetical protein
MSEVLVERAFEVPVANDSAWRALADLDRWPQWAPHIAAVTITPRGPLGPGTEGSFRFRPFGRSRFAMTAFDPPRSWTWRGRALGVVIDYDHRFEPVSDGVTRLVWTVRSAQPGLRTRLFARVYARLIDRAWPRFRDSLGGQDA